MENLKILLKRTAIILWLFSIHVLVFAQSDSMNIQYLMKQGQSFRKKDSSRAIAFTLQAIEQAKNSHDQLAEIQGDFLLVKIFTDSQQLEKAYEVLQKAKGAAEKLKHIPSILEANDLLAKLYLKKNEYKKAIDQGRETIALADTIKTNRLWRANAECTIGNCQMLLSQFDSSMASYIKALRIFESIPDTAGMILVYRYIGNLHLLSKNLGDALNTFQLNSAYVNAFGDSSDKALNVKNIGVVYQKRGESAKSREYYYKSLVYSKGQGLHIDDAITLGNIGSSYMDEGRVEEGLLEMLKALELKKKYGASPNSIMHTLFDLSRAYRLLGDNKKSTEYAEAVIEMARKNEDALSLQYGYKYLSEANYAAENYKQAYDDYRRYSNLKDSIFSEEKSKQIKELEISYESEKKDQEITFLEKDRMVEKSRKQMFLMMTFAFLLIIGVFFNRQRLRARKNRELLLQGQEVDRLKSDFFANVSHEFRTPLTLILGPIQSKLAMVADLKEREELLMMQRNAIRLRRLIDDILDLSKFEAGKLDLQNASTNISECISGLAATFTSLAESKAINYNLEVDAAIYGMVDKHKLETVLINLLSNAFKYTPDGGNIWISAKSEKGFLSIKVKDSGPGIPEEKLLKIFDRFYQVDDSEGRKIKGTGIGLAFSKELVAMQGGNLEVQSTVDEGSCFSFSIAYFPEKYVGELESEDTPDTIQNGTFEKMTSKELDVSELPLILLIEDNEDVRNYIYSILTETCQVLFANNGLEGRDKAFDIIPDLIISDVMMPIMDGFELCAAVKSDIRTAHIPVILLTAKSSAESRIKGLEQEADVYMSKPFNPLELELQVRNLLNLQERQRDRYKTSNELTIPLSIDCNSMEQKFLSKLEEVMASNYKDQEFTSELLGSELAISRSQLHRKLKAISGESASKFIRIYRLKIAYKLISDQTGSISQIAYEVGFNNVSYFNKCFKETFGIQPSELIV